MSMQFGRMKSEMDIARNIRENRDSDIYIYIYIYTGIYRIHIYVGTRAHRPGNSMQRAEYRAECEI